MRHQTDSLKTALQNKRSELARAIRAQSSQLIVDGGEHELIDRIHGMSRREEAVTFMDALTRTLAAVDSALLAMKDGSYGSCSECGAAISSRRMQAIPWAANCIRCQEAIDRYKDTRGASTRWDQAA
jgi:DnaK suppressor protein